MEKTIHARHARRGGRHARSTPGGEPALATGTAPGERAARHSKKNLGHNLRSAQQRFARIKTMNPEYPIADLCAALAVTRSGYHAWASRRPGRRAQADAALWPLIQQA